MQAVVVTEKVRRSVVKFRRPSKADTASTAGSTGTPRRGASKRMRIAASYRLIPPPSAGSATASRPEIPTAGREAFRDTGGKDPGQPAPKNEEHPRIELP